MHKLSLSRVLLALVSLLLWVDGAVYASHLMFLAPAELHASLTFTQDHSTQQWSLEASDGGILMIQTTSMEVRVPDVDLTNLSSIQVTWTPQSTPVSSTFDRLFGTASPSTLPFLFSSGVHVRLRTTSTSLDDTNHLVTALMNAAPASLRSLFPDRNKARELAKSLCASTGFTDHKSSDYEACFAASFEPPMIDDDILKGVLSFPTLSITASSRLVAAYLRPSATDKATLTVNLVRTLVTSFAELESSSLSIVEDPPQSVVIVKGVDFENNAASVISVSNGAESIQGLVPMAVMTTSDVAIAVLGEGFHRRVRVDLRDVRDCSSGDKVLMVVSLSSSMYADLDELRRMERFGELRLHSPAKHIEIERPMAVSSQHVIALEFSIDKTRSSHTFEFPIHLRYQSPSNSTLYAPATLVGPEIFVSCGSKSQSPRVDITEPLEPLLSQWIVDATWAATAWRRVIPRSPLAPVSVPVPVGFIPHGPLVSTLTITVTCIGALLLVYVSLTAPTRTSTSGCLWKPKTL